MLTQNNIQRSRLQESDTVLFGPRTLCCDVPSVLLFFLSLSVRPTYHWSLNKLIKDRIPGSPGPAIRTHGEMTAIRGGLHLNGHNAWLGAGDFSGGCISGMLTS